MKKSSDVQDQHKSFAASFVLALQQALGGAGDGLSLHEPEFVGNEWKYVKECLDTGWVSSVGKYADEFECRLAEYTGARHAVAVVNGTAAQHMALLLVGVQPGDEVLVPSLSFVATANAVAHCGAIPHFVDCTERTLGLDPVRLEEHLERVSELVSGGLRNVITGRRIAGVVPMHTFGHPVEIIELMRVAGRFGLPVIEDAAESLGSRYQGRHTGTFGQVGILSFNGNKIITTGGGGAILTNDSELARRAKHLTTTAKRPHRWEFFHDEVAYNYRLPNLNAALGCAQMERIPSLLQRKRQLAERYQDVFGSKKGMLLVKEPHHCHSNYWLNAVRLEKPDLVGRDILLAAANDAGLQCRPAWKLLHTLPMYLDCPRADLPVAVALEASLINIPSSAKLVELRP
jgi:perosamine synthetase